MILKGKEISPALLLSSLFWSLILSIAIRILSLNQIFQLLTSRRVSKKYSEETIINSVNLALSLQSKFIPQKCWKKSMILFRFLMKNGYNVKMHFGVSVTDFDKDIKKRSLYGHAWVTLNNTTITNNDEKLSPSLTEIISYP